MAWPEAATGLAVALGCGLLIGLERERRKGRGDDRAAAGIRSFAVTAFGGALAQSLGQPWLVIAGALLVAALAALGYRRSRSRDPGITTELALFATYLVGVQASLAPALGAACGAALAVLLAARTQLHRFATRWLNEAELHDLLLLAALALVVLPLVPDAALPWLGGIRPRPLVALVVLILVLQAAGHLALRLLGRRYGLAASGFFSGFVSSTATIASCGARARAEPQHRRAWAGAGAASTCATWVLAMVLSAALSPAAAAQLALPALAGATAALGAAAWLLFRERGSETAPVQATLQRGAMRLREALFVAGLLSIVTLVVAQAQRGYGAAGLFTGVALASLADAHAPIASLAALHAAHSVDDRQFVHGVLLAVAANSMVRLATAVASGGAHFAWRIGVALVFGLAAAGGTALLAA